MSQRPDQTNPRVVSVRECQSHRVSEHRQGQSSVLGPRFGIVSDKWWPGDSCQNGQSPGILMAVWDHNGWAGVRERSAPCIVTSSHCNTDTWATSCYACEGRIKSVKGWVIRAEASRVDMSSVLLSLVWPRDMMSAPHQPSQWISAAGKKQSPYCYRVRDNLISMH